MVQGLQNVDLHTAVQMLGCWALRVEVLNSDSDSLWQLRVSSFEIQSEGPRVCFIDCAKIKPTFTPRQLAPAQLKGDDKLVLLLLLSETILTTPARRGLRNARGSAEASGRSLFRE